MFRFLLIDDNPEDRVLSLRELNREFPALEVEEIIEADGFSQALSVGNFDLVVTDYQLGWNNGLTILREIKSHYPDCPVIMFTDSGSQEIAVEAMKAGLDDYIIKSPKHYVRLPIAIRHALQRAESQHRAERLEMRLQTLLHRLNVGVFRSTLDGHLLDGNASFLRLLGVSSFQEAQTLNLQELFLQPDVELPVLHPEREVLLRRSDGNSIWVCVSQILNTTEAEPIIEGLIEDIAERKLAQKALQQANEELEIRVAERTQELRQVNEQLLQEIQQRDRVQLALKESEAYHRQLVEVCPLAIFICICSTGQFVFVNSAAVKLYGATSPSDLIGKRVFDQLHPDYHEIVKERMRQVREEGTPTALMEQKLIRLDGTVIHVEVAAAPFTYQQMPAAQVVIQDISDRKIIEAELHKTLEKERELNQLKSRIISTLSHEYRTPLTTILSSAELLEHYTHRLTEEKKRLHLQRIQTSSKHLSDLVSDALFIGQAEADKLTVNPAPLNLEKFCRELVAVMRSGVTNQTTITFTSRGNCTNTCLDEKLLRQILSNLLSNAIKYSLPGSTVRFDLKCMDGVAAFRIQDQGIGIPPQDVSQLFESFHRASNVGTIPGTGLGLAIVKKCVDLQEGQITLDSVVGVGTTFTVTLPLESKPLL